MVTTNVTSIKEKYDDDGYVFIPGFLNEEEVENINEKLKSFIRDNVADMPDNFVFYEDKNDPATLKQLQDIQNYDPFFSKILNESRFKEIANVLLAENVIGKSVEYFNKPARIGKLTPAHQDNYYFMLTPPQAITMWMALENVDEENGCLRYIKGSHLNGMRRHSRTKSLGFSQGITDYSEEEFAKEVALAAKPGDLLIHHSMTIHRADANQSHRSRKSLGFIYFGESAKEDKEAKEAYQLKLIEERFVK
jgi:phytanoyl-CoA hydroxylase